MSNLFSSSKTSDTKSATGPWAAQQPYVKDAFQQSQDLYNQKSGSAAYSGPTYATIDPLTKQAVGATADYATGAGATGANATSLAGLGLLGQSGNYTDQLGRYATSAGTDHTGQITADAAQYANNPALNGAIDASSRDVVRNLNEDTLPGIDRTAVGTGNINSSRTGVAEGIAQRGAADQVGDIASTMRANAYNAGLNHAQTDVNTNQAALGDAASKYGTAVDEGRTAAGQGQDASYQNLAKLGSAGQTLQQNQQGINTAAAQNWQANDTRQQSLLDAYYRTIGANNWGSQGTSTTKVTDNPSLAQGIAGLAATAASIYAGVPPTGIPGSVPTIGLSDAFNNALSTPLSFGGLGALSPISIPKLGG